MMSVRRRRQRQRQEPEGRLTLTSGGGCGYQPFDGVHRRVRSFADVEQLHREGKIDDSDLDAAREHFANLELELQSRYHVSQY